MLRVPVAFRRRQLCQQIDDVASYAQKWTIYAIALVMMK